MIYRILTVALLMSVSAVAQQKHTFVVENIKKPISALPETPVDSIFESSIAHSKGLDFAILIKVTNA